MDSHRVKCEWIADPPGVPHEPHHQLSVNGASREDQSVDVWLGGPQGEQRSHLISSQANHNCKLEWAFPPGLVLLSPEQP